MSASVGQNRPKGPDIAEGQSAASQVIENVGLLDTEKGPHTLLKYRFQWEHVNEVTWKLTDGEGSNVPACHGHWGGYRVTKAVAWVISLVPGAWLARCGDRACGPSSLNEAKSAAMAMARGGADGDYQVSDPIAHLNGMTARLLDEAARRASTGGGA